MTGVSLALPFKSMVAVDEWQARPDKLCPQHKAVSFSIVEPDRSGEVDLV